MATTTEIERQLVESLAREAALAEVLGVMSRTPPDLQAVLDTVVERAARLCGAGMGGYLFLVAGDRFHLAAVTPDPRPEVAAYREQIRQGGPVASAFVVKRVVESKGVVYIRDATVDGETEAYRQNSKDFGYRSMLGVPLIRSGEIVGVLSLQRPDVRAFSDREVALVRAFADQAAIAVENARLFGETTEALERQTAMAEVLGTIAGSPTDLQAVLDVIARNAAQFCAAEDASVLLLRDGMMSSVAHHGPLPQPTNPWPPDRTSGSGRAVAEVLGAIGRSAFDLDRVLTTIAECAMRLADADTSSIVRIDRGVGEIASVAGPPEQVARRRSFWAGRKLTPGRDSVVGRVLLEWRTVQIEDIRSDPEFDLKNTAGVARTVLGVPLMVMD